MCGPEFVKKKKNNFDYNILCIADDRENVPHDLYIIYVKYSSIYLLYRASSESEFFGKHLSNGVHSSVNDNGLETPYLTEMIKRSIGYRYLTYLYIYVDNYLQRFYIPIREILMTNEYQIKCILSQYYLTKQSNVINNNYITIVWLRCLST